MNVYYLSKFNNYYNRQLKKYDTIYLEDFEPFIVQIDSDKNFNPNDNVRTSVTINVDDLTDVIDIDYVLLSENNYDIVSKWYVVERTRSRKGQWILELKRDLLSDYFSQIKASPIFFEKGWVGVGNPLIFNSENMTFNQIKTKEILLNDKSNTPWIVGYLANNYSEASGADAGNITSSFTAENTIYPELSWLDYRIINTIYTGGKDQTLITRLRNTSNGRIYDIKQSGSYSQKTDNPNISGLPYIPSASTNFFCDIPEGDNVPLNSIFNDYYNKPKFTVNLNTAGFTNTAPYIENIDNLLEVNNIKVKNSDYIPGEEANYGPEYFYIKLVPQGKETKTVYLSYGSGDYNRAKTLVQEVYQNSIFSDYFEFRNYSTNGNTFAIEFTTMKYAFGISKTGSPTNVTTSFLNLQDKEKRALIDAPYVMFASPYFDVTYINSIGEEKQHNGEAARNIAAEAIKRFSGGYAYDLQLLPYCPIPSLIKDNKFDMTGLQADSFATMFAGENEVGFFIFPETSSFTNVINLDNPISMPNNALEAKVEIETNICRLISPNYAGAFEFTPLKNGGLSSFEINCTYKPYQPYIHVNPYFNSGYLYGGDYNDNRGLICGGDFSLPQTSDAWIAYQSQNKSFRESFNRQIENMEITNSVQREREVISAITGGISGAISGATSGALAGGAGGPIASAIGAGVGLTAGIAGNIYGAIKDIELSDRLRAEGLDLTKDMFGYQLKNIQALPNTVSRTSSFDINNKLYPVLEFYTCTEVEKNSLRNKIKYNGMTVMTIGYLDEYTDYNSRLIKGQLIRLQNRFGESIGEYHEAIEIASELMKGVYI